MNSPSSQRLGRLTALLPLIAFIFALGQVGEPTSAPSPGMARDSLIRSIQEAARKDVAANKPIPSPQDLNVLYGAEAAAAGLNLRDVKQTYEDAYKAAQDELPFYVRYRPTWGWLLAILLGIYIFITKVWNDSIYPHLKEFNDRIYRKYAGHKIFHKKSLRSYRQELISEYGKFKPPFSTERELDMNQVYVPLQIQGKSDEKPLDAFNVIESQRRLMVTGTPGAGKSMLLKRYALTYATESAKAMPEKPVPVLFPLRRLNEDNRPLADQIATVMEEKDFPKPHNFINASLKRGALMVLFDGLDEVNSSKRTEVVSRIKDFLRQHDKCWTVITCRTAVYNNEFNEVIKQTLEVQPFTDQEIQSFLYSWKSMPPGKSPEQLFSSLNDKPSIKALARNPLLLTMIVILYSDLKTFELPHSRADFYKNAADAFLNLNKYRDQPNSYLVPQKRLVLEHLALYNQDSGAVRDQDRISIDYKTIIKQTEKLLPELGLKAEDGVPLLQEITEQSGLLMPIDDGTKYQFSHLTLQEYFTASALKDDAAGLLDRFKKDPTAWRETVLLWCGLDHDSTEFIRGIYAEDRLTAFQCLADALKVNSRLAETIIDDFKPRLGDAADSEAVVRTFALVAAGPYERNQKVFTFLSSELSSNGNSQRLLSAAKALALTNKQAAANLLASMYDSKPEVQIPLTQMGDLAVDAFVKQAHEGHFQAINALQRIGTPRAAAALLPFIWIENQMLVTATKVGVTLPTKSHHLSTAAAKSLAVLFAQENVLEHLRKQPLYFGEMTLPRHDWVWKPFDEPEDSALPVIAGRIAYLLARSPDKEMPSEGPYIDPRIAIPVTIAVRSRPSLADISFNVVARRVNEILKLAPPSSFTEGDFDAAAYISLLRQTPEVEWEFAETLMMAKPALRLKLLQIANNSLAPTSSDWVNIRNPSTYDFGKSWHYKLVCLFVGVISCLTIYSIVSGFGRPIVPVLNVARLLSLILVGGILLILTLENWRVSLPGPRDIKEIFGGPYLDWIRFKNNFGGSDEPPTKIMVAFFATLTSPIHLFFTSALLLRFFTGQFVLLFWIVVFAAVIGLWRTGMQKERISKNPLRPLLSEVIAAKEEA